MHVLLLSVTTTDRAVTLHNSALVGMEKDPTTGFRKLNWLLVNPPFPPETFGNLLLLYAKHGCYDLAGERRAAARLTEGCTVLPNAHCQLPPCPVLLPAADVMADNAHLTMRFLSPDLYEFLDATIAVQIAPEDAYRKYDTLAGGLPHTPMVGCMQVAASPHMHCHHGAPSLRQELQAGTSKTCASTQKPSRTAAWRTTTRASRPP